MTLSETKSAQFLFFDKTGAIGKNEKLLTFAYFGSPRETEKDNKKVCKNKEWHLRHFLGTT
jgi:hypothetical protein